MSILLSIICMNRSQIVLYSNNEVLHWPAVYKTRIFSVATWCNLSINKCLLIRKFLKFLFWSHVGSIPSLIKSNLLNYNIKQHSSTIILIYLYTFNSLMKTLYVVHLDKLYRVIVPNTWNVIKNRNLLDMFDVKKYRCTSGALEFTPSFCGVCAAQYFFLCCVLCIIVFLPFFVQPLYYVSFDLRLLIAPLGIVTIFAWRVVNNVTIFVWRVVNKSNTLKVHIC